MRLPPKAPSKKAMFVFRCIMQFWKENHGPPTIREVADRAGISSTSVTNYYLSQLEDAGKILPRSEFGKTRNIFPVEIVDAIDAYFEKA